jgi:hypothetical protein
MFGLTLLAARCISPAGLLVLQSPVPPSVSQLLQPQELGLTADMPNVKALAGALSDCVCGAVWVYLCLQASSLCCGVVQQPGCCASLRWCQTLLLACTAHSRHAQRQGPGKCAFSLCLARELLLRYG